jgi:hypothetical protein
MFKCSVRTIETNTYKNRDDLSMSKRITIVIYIKSIHFNRQSFRIHQTQINMNEVIDKLIIYLEDDNKQFLLALPNKEPIFKYTRASEKDIMDFEKHFALILPDCLKVFYKNFNAIKANFMFIDILGMSNVISNYEDYPSIQKLVNQKIIPIANENGDLVCIDTKKDINQIIYFSQEEDDLSETHQTIEEYIESLIKQKIEFVKNL